MAVLRVLDPDPEAVPDLALSRAQRAFVGSRAMIVASLRGKPAGTCASLVIDDPDPVAFVSLRFGAGRPHWASPGAVTLHSLLVDLAHQGRGHAHAVMRGAVEHVRTVAPRTEAIELAVNLRNTVARAVYLGFGFTDTGRQTPGPVGDQAILSYPLAGQGAP